MIPPTKKVTTIIFEEHVVTQEKWQRSYSWQMTLRLGLSEPPCVWHITNHEMVSLILAQLTHVNVYNHSCVALTTYFVWD